MTYVTNRNASVILVPVAVYVGMGDPSDLAREPFLLKGERRRFTVVRVCGGNHSVSERGCMPEGGQSVCSPTATLFGELSEHE